MNIVNVAAACVNQTPMAIKNNCNNIVEVAFKAEQNGVGLLCLPELCVTGYGCEDAFFYQDLLEISFDFVRDMALHTSKQFAFSVGFPLWFAGSLYNCNALLADGKVQGIVPKRMLAIDGVHYEERWFRAWDKGIVDQYRGIPFGDLIFDLGNVRVGFEVCEEAWVPNRTAKDLCERGVDIVLNPSASHFSFGKSGVRQRFVEDGSRAFACGYVYANLLGNEAGRIIYDGDCLVAANGNILAEGKRFSFEAHEFTVASIDVDSLRSDRMQRNGFKINNQYVENSRINIECHIVCEGVESERVTPQTIRKEEEFVASVSLGLFDYMRKTGSKGYIVSLSGGADSSAVACLVSEMKRRSQEALGERVFGRSGLTEDEFENILRCYYLSSQNSSEDTLESARELTDCLGVNLGVLKVGDVIAQYEKMVEESIERNLTWEEDDIARQNIQARARSPMVWMFVNIYNSILLTTSNRSEAAVGYATMDGDTSGGLNPIGGIDKSFLRQWLRYMEDRIPGLKKVNSLQPTAELRPLESNQTDEDDLMPYDVLNEIERMAIGKKFSPQKVLSVLFEKFKQYEVEKMEDWVRIFYRLWSRNQWKRERYAPCFHVDDRNLDPKTWCRFPILNGGFRDQLAFLQDSRRFLGKGEER